MLTTGVCYFCCLRRSQTRTWKSKHLFLNPGVSASLGLMPLAPSLSAPGPGVCGLGTGMGVRFVSVSQPFTPRNGGLRGSSGGSHARRPAWEVCLFTPGASPLRGPAGSRREGKHPWIQLGCPPALREGWGAAREAGPGRGRVLAGGGSQNKCG